MQGEALFRILTDALSAAMHATTVAGSSSSSSPSADAQAAAARPAGGGSADEAVRSALHQLLEKLPQPFNMVEVESRVKEKTPYVVVALQVGGRAG